MAIEYTEEKRFTVEQVEALFKSVGWESAQWPERLFKALQHSDTVISAWDGGYLVGLVRVLDDTGGAKVAECADRGSTYVVVDGYPVAMFTIRPLVHTVKITADVRRCCAMTRDHE